MFLPLLCRNFLLFFIFLVPRKENLFLLYGMGKERKNEEEAKQKAIMYFVHFLKKKNHKYIYIYHSVHLFSMINRIKRRINL